MIRIAPSLLSADFARLEQEVASVTRGGADLLHLDVMDGHFVPNITFGPVLVKSVDRITSLELDVHLMISDPAAYVEAFARAGADIISFHVEAVKEPERVVEMLLGLGVKASLALNPDTGLARVRPLLDRLAMVLVMTVVPGFGGQAFQPKALDKVRALRDLGFEQAIEVDGGISQETAPQAVQAGADVLVAGSAIFGAPQRGKALAAIRDAALLAGQGTEG